MSDSIDKIVIVGGGSAGWMSASLLKKMFPNKNITVVESPNIKPIGVGESTYDGIRHFFSLLEIDEKEFFKGTDASIKLGIEFKNFYDDTDKDDIFYYPFGEPNLENSFWGLEDWFVRKNAQPDLPVTDYAESYFPAAHFMKHNKMTDNKSGVFGSFNMQQYTALHFDAIKFGLWLKENYCSKLGVNHISQNVVDVVTNENGVDYLVLSNNEKIYADLFIDCSGFKSLLLGKTLNEPFISYEDLLPNNRAWATQIPYTNKEKELRNLTKVVGMPNGWTWNIYLWSRIGLGYVYSDKFITPENALKELKDYLKSNNMDYPLSDEQIDNLEFNDIPFRVGRHQRSWVKNVVGIGLAGGFLEPLESNGLFTVHEYLFQLVRALQRKKTTQWEKDVYNEETKQIFQGFAEFLKIHYALSIRTDTDYWKNNFNQSYDFSKPSLSSQYSAKLLKLKLSKTNTFIPQNEGTTWIATGMHYFSLDPISNRIGQINNQMDYKKDFQELFKHYDNRKDWWKKNTLKTQSFYNFMLKHYYSEGRMF